MTIHLPDDLENSVRSLVQGGRFASEDDLIAEAVRAFLRQQNTVSRIPAMAVAGSLRDELGPDPLLGSMRDAADELDEIVADTYRKRREETWRDLDLE